MSHSNVRTDGDLQVHLLEINAEPAIDMTGPRLTWILEDLFISIAHTCIAPFIFDQRPSEVANDDKQATKEYVPLVKCYQVLL